MNSLFCKRIGFYTILIGSMLLSSLFGNARVSFTRPSSLMRTPFSSEIENFNQYIVGFGGEITHFSKLNYSSASYFQGSTPNGYHFGLSYNKGLEYLVEDVALASVPSYLSFHFHKSVFKRNNIGVSIGVHDMLYTAKAPHRVSAFSIFSYNKKIKNKYNLASTLGFGTGYLANDSHDSESESSLTSSNKFFLGLKLTLPALKEKGGLGVLLEYDGSGINVGTSIPINKAWTVNVGITHFENIAKFGDWGSNNNILDDAPALALGFQMNIPKLKYKKVSSSVKGLSNIYSQMPYDESLDSLIRHATVIINSLEDSLNNNNEANKTLKLTNQELNQKINFLQDSLGLSALDNKILIVNLNKAMKYLSSSLEAYYAQDYTVALEKTEQAIEILPDLAIAYARKGSIYYRLGDTTRATINWNIALNLDPEYDEVRIALQNVKNNKDLNTIKLPE